MKKRFGLRRLRGYPARLPYRAGRTSISPSVISGRLKRQRDGRRLARVPGDVKQRRPDCILRGGGGRYPFGRRDRRGETTVCALPGRTTRARFAGGSAHSLFYLPCNDFMPAVLLCVLAFVLWRLVSAFRPSCAPNLIFFFS